MRRGVEIECGLLLRQRKGQQPPEQELVVSGQSGRTVDFYVGSLAALVPVGELVFAAVNEILPQGASPVERTQRMLDEAQLGDSIYPSLFGFFPSLRRGH